jgi:leucyl aminopeptidase
MKYFRLLIFTGFYFFIFSGSLLFCAENKAQLFFSEMTVKPGQSLEIPVLLKYVPNMAGIKLAFQYDKELLTYLRSEKTKTTASLMHIVNDKHPGKLIIVMAGARGVSVNNQSIMNLFFKVNNNISKSVDTKFKITELQLMSDNLKELAYELNISPIHIKASKNAKSESEQKIETKKQTNISKEKPQSQKQNKTPKEIKTPSKVQEQNIKY